MKMSEKVSRQETPCQQVLGQKALKQKARAFLYGAALQWKLDMRSKSLLVACYAVPLIFFLLMGGIFTSVMPEMKETLIQAMLVMGVSLGSFIGLPPTLVETYGSEVKKTYRANGVPLWAGFAAMFISAFLHLATMCAAVILLAPVLFGAVLPPHLPPFCVSLAVYIISSLFVGSLLGLAMKNQAKLTMIAQLIFLPTIMLSGIMFPISFLPQAFATAGKLLPASWGYLLMLDGGLRFENLRYLLIVIFASVLACAMLLRRHKVL